MTEHNTTTEHRIPGGFLVVFEGIDGGGKSTLAAGLAQRLVASGWLVTVTNEPSSITPLGSELRRILKAPDLPLAPWAECFLFEADRAQSWAFVIAPALNDGHVVISDRGPFGSIAYQGYGRGCDVDEIYRMNERAWPSRPQLVFVVDIPPAAGLERKGGTSRDRFEGGGLQFLDAARAGYLAAARKRGAGTVVVEGMLDHQDVMELVSSATLAALATASGPPDP